MGALRFYFQIFLGKFLVTEWRGHPGDPRLFARHLSTTVIDQNGCSGTSNSITTTVLPAPSGYATSASPTCWLGSDGSVEAFISEVQLLTLILGTPARRRLLHRPLDLPPVTILSQSPMHQAARSLPLPQSWTGNKSQVPSHLPMQPAVGALTGPHSTGSSGSAPYTYLWDTDNLSGTSFNVTAGTKSPAHPQFGVGSANGYSINGVEERVDAGSRRYVYIQRWHNRLSIYRHHRPERRNTYR